MGSLLAGLHLRAAFDLWSTPTVMVVGAFVRLELSLLVALVGVVMIEGRFADRTLVWVGVGALVFGVATGWPFADATARGRTVPRPARVRVE